METVVGGPELGPAVVRLLNEQCRLAGATCLDRDDYFVVLYHFHQELDLVTLQVRVGKDEQLPGISGICPAAVLVENEMKELFGVQISDIGIDYQGQMLLVEESPRQPLRK